mgnify:CR=1 FL=1
MATQAEISRTYDWIDEIFRLSMGEHGDFTCAFYDGDYSKTLEKAQADKHEYILNGIRFHAGLRVLDIGSGWGPMLRAVESKAGEAVGLTLSPAQARWCLKRGLKVLLQDYKTTDPQKLGMFDGVVSVGAFEHFCSISEFLAGKQEQIYQQFFQFCASVLPPGGRLYLQTMTWGKAVPDPGLIEREHPAGSDEFHLKLATHFYPGSWLPSGLDQMKKCGEPSFDFISSNNGRLDYIKTLTEWGKRANKFSFKLLAAKVKLLPRYLADKEFRTQLRFVFNGSQSEIFKRNLFSHERMIFEKR